MNEVLDVLEIVIYIIMLVTCTRMLLKKGEG